MASLSTQRAILLYIVPASSKTLGIPRSTDRNECLRVHNVPLSMQMPRIKISPYSLPDIPDIILTDAGRSFKHLSIMKNKSFAMIAIFFNIVLIGISGGLTLLAASPASANMQLNDRFSKISLGRYTEILEDPQGLLTINEVTREPSTTRFRPNPSVNISLGMTRSTYWLRFRLAGDIALSENLVLLCDSATLKEVSLYLPVKNNNRIEYREMSGGWNIPDGHL